MKSEPQYPNRAASAIALAWSAIFLGTSIAHFASPSVIPLWVAIVVWLGGPVIFGAVCFYNKRAFGTYLPFKTTGEKSN